MVQCNVNEMFARHITADRFLNFVGKFNVETNRPQRGRLDRIGTTRRSKVKRIPQEEHGRTKALQINVHAKVGENVVGVKEIRVGR